jgi:hypothetical protein
MSRTFSKTSLDGNEGDMNPPPSINMALSGCPPFLRQIGPFSTVIGRDQELSIIKENYQARRTPCDDSPIIQVSYLTPAVWK